jgi:hypothetical protein
MKVGTATRSQRRRRTRDGVAIAVRPVAGPTSAAGGPVTPPRAGLAAAHCTLVGDGVAVGVEPRGAFDAGAGGDFGPKIGGDAHSDEAAAVHVEPSRDGGPRCPTARRLDRRRHHLPPILRQAGLCAERIDTRHNPLSLREPLDVLREVAVRLVTSSLHYLVQRVVVALGDGNFADVR